MGPFLEHNEAVILKNIKWWKNGICRYIFSSDIP